MCSYSNYLLLSGQQYNKDGNRVKWWTDYSINNFKKRTQCFVNQYNQYTLQGYGVWYITISCNSLWYDSAYIQINGQLTLGENIADNGGIHTAFRAYKNVMNGTSEPYVGGHSGDQLFFVAFAQVIAVFVYRYITLVIAYVVVVQ